MAIQIRRGSNAEWEVNNSNIVVGEPAVATDSKRAFIGTASGAYMELANLEAIAPAYDTGNSYAVDDYVSYQGKLYVCTVPTSGAWNASCWQVTTLGRALAENAYSNFEMQTVSGDIVSFPNGAGGIPVKDLKAEVVATQNLNGYDHPWVGGAGKNILNVTNFTVGQSKTSNGVTCTYNEDGSFTLNGTSTADNSFWNLNYTANQQAIPVGTAYKMVGGTSAVSLQASGYSSGIVATNNSATTATSFTIPSDNVSTWIRIQINNSGTTVNNVQIRPMLMANSETDTTWEPYSNICPISGWENANVYVRGKNLCPKLTALTNFPSGVTATVDGDGAIHISGTTTPNNKLSSSVSISLAKGTYTVSEHLGSEENVYLQVFNITKSEVYWGGGSNETFTYNGTDSMAVRLWFRGSSTISETIYPMIRVASDTDATFEPYNGQTYTIDLDGTRYGGTLDVTTGLLTVDWVGFDGGDKTWTKSTGQYTSFYCSTSPQIADNRSEICCKASCYKGVSYDNVLPNNDAYVWSRPTGHTLAVKDTSKDSLSAGDFKTAMTGQTFMYKLATLQTYQLTPQQVRTLLGNNNIWADSGEVEVTYRISNVQ